MRHAPLQKPLIWQVYLLCWICGSLAMVWPLPALVCLGLILFLDRRLWNPARLIAAAALAGGAFFLVWQQFSPAKNIDLHTPAWALDQSASSLRICGEIAESRGIVNGRFRIILKNVSPQWQDSPLPGQCMLTWENPPAGLQPLPGQHMCLTRPVKRVHAFLNESEEEIPPAFMAQNIFWRVYAQGLDGEPKIFGSPDKSSLIRHGLQESFLKALTLYSPMTQAKAILVALIFGDKFYLGKNVNDNFASASLAHSLALSGQHLCVAGLFGILAILAIMRQYPGICLHTSRLTLVTLASLPFALIYLWLGDAPASLIRAFCMLAVLAFFLVRKCAFSSADVLATALLIILAINPCAIFDLGLDLSILCVACLAITAPAFALFAKNHSASPIRKFIVMAGQILLVTIIIQIFILPLSLTVFQRGGMLFLPNLIWLPLLAAITLPFAAIGLCLAALSLVKAAAISLYIAALPCQFIIWLLERLQNWGAFYEPAFILPGWPVFIAFGGLFILICRLFNKNLQSSITGLFLCLMGGMLLLGPLQRLMDSLSSPITLEALDVGQGQAILIKLPKNKILVDGGGTPPDRFDLGKNVLRPALTQNSPPYINALVNTHPDLDHLGGFFHLLETFKIDSIFHNGQKASSQFQDNWQRFQLTHDSHILTRGNILVPGSFNSGFRLEVLHPPAGKTKNWRGNDASLILRLWKHDKSLAIICGDAGVEALNSVMENYPDLSAKILVAPHHGSNKNFSNAFFSAVNPELAIISCGYQNQWNFPGKDVTSWFEFRNIPLYVTSRVGRVKIIFDQDLNYKVRTAKRI